MLTFTETITVAPGGPISAAQIVYACTDSDDDICIANADGTGTRLNLSDTVGGDTGNDFHPQWSP